MKLTLDIEAIAAARAQQVERVRRIGVLAAHERHVPEFDGLREQLRELAYIEGKNLLIEWRYATQVCRRCIVGVHAARRPSPQGGG